MFLEKKKVQRKNAKFHQEGLLFPKFRSFIIPESLLIGVREVLARTPTEPITRFFSWLPYIRERDLRGKSEDSYILDVELGFFVNLRKSFLKRLRMFFLPSWLYKVLF